MNPKLVAVFIEKQSGEAWPYQGVHANCNGTIVMDGDDLIYTCLACKASDAMLQILMTESNHRKFMDIQRNPGNYKTEYWDFDQAKPYFEPE